MAHLGVKQLLRFVTVGVLNTGLGYVVIFACMYWVGLSAVLSNLTGYAVGMVVSYFLNRIYTFRSVAGKKREVVRFLSIFVAAYLVNIGVLLLLVDHTRIYHGLAQVVAGLVYTVVFYVLSKHYVFAPSKSKARLRNEQEGGL